MRRTIITAAIAVASIAATTAPAMAAKPTLSSLNKRLTTLEGLYAGTKAQLAEQTKLNAQYKKCFERTFLGEGFGYLYNSTGVTEATPGPFTVNSYAYGLFFPPALEGPVNTPFANANHRFWAVGVKNETTCLSLFSFRQVRPAFALASPASQRALRADR